MMSSATLDQAIAIGLKYYRTAGPLCGLSYSTETRGDASSLTVVAVNEFEEILCLDPSLGTDGVPVTREGAGIDEFAENSEDLEPAE